MFKGVVLRMKANASIKGVKLYLIFKEYNFFENVQMDMIMPRSAFYAIMQNKILVDEYKVEFIWFIIHVDYMVVDGGR